MIRFAHTLVFVLSLVAGTSAHAAFIMDTPRVKGAQPQAPAPGGNEGAASALMGARDQAAIYRVRSMIGANQYAEKIDCSSGDVNIGTNSRQPTYVGNLTVVTGGVCPRNGDRVE